MKHVLRAAAVAAALALTAAAPQQQLHIVNLMPSFWQAWDSTKGQPLSDRVSEFKVLVVQPNAAVYGFDEFSRNLQSDDAIAAYLQSLTPRAAQMRTLGFRLARELPTDEAAFMRALPDFDSSRVVVYFMPSFLHFAGQTHDLGSKIGVLFGVDRMAEQSDVNPGVVVAHELYHIYQFENHPGYRTDRATLGQAIWGEGSAAYASQVLTPGATKAQALSSELAHATPETVRIFACAIDSKWNSHNQDLFDLYLDAGQSPPNMPPMGGYLVGYLAAKDLSKTYSVSELAKLTLPQIESVVRPQVGELCKTGASS